MAKKSSSLKNPRAKGRKSVASNSFVNPHAKGAGSAHGKTKKSSRDMC